VETIEIHKGIFLVENFLSDEEIRKFQDKFSKDIWRYGWSHRLLYDAPPCWHSFLAGTRRVEYICCESELQASERWSFVYPIWLRIKEQFMPQQVLIGAYANAHTATQEGSAHMDNSVEEQGITALIFPNPIWPVAWGGETVFYDANNTRIVASVLPKPGSLVVFNGRVSHQVRGPSVLSRGLRASIAFKTVSRDFAMRQSITSKTGSEE